MRFAAFGRTQVFHSTILLLAEAGHKPVLIGTARAAAEYTKGEADFEMLADRYGCPFFSQSTVSLPAIRSLVSASAADVCISINWPTLITPDTIALFSHGVINAHAGDLPRFRGNACPNWAILIGESSMTVTLHKMDSSLDSGPVLLQQSVEILPDTHIGDLYRAVETMVPPMYVTVLNGLESGATIERPQSNEIPLRCLPRRPVDSLIDWSNSATLIDRLIRASSEPFAGAFSFLEGTLVRIWRCSLVAKAQDFLGIPGQVIAIDGRKGSVEILCGQGSLEILEMSLDNGERLKACELIRSTRQRLGVDVFDLWHRLQFGRK